MNSSEFPKSMSFLELGKGQLHIKIKNNSLINLLANQRQMLSRASLGRGNVSLYEFSDFYLGCDLKFGRNKQFFELIK